MTATLKGIAARFDALSLRERVLVLVAFVVVLGFVLQALLIGPARQENERVRARAAQQLKVLEATREAARVLEQSTRDPDAANRARRDELLRQIAAFDQQLEAAARGLVPAERMAALLEGLVGHERRLKVVGLRSLTPSPLVPRPAGAKAEPAPAEPASGIYRHGLEVTLQGSYADLTEYVAALERLPARMYFGRAALDAQAYPRVTLTLTLYTLSLERTWLRV
jgi:MSHA biogenesis protein MshJ